MRATLVLEPQCQGDGSWDKGPEAGRDFGSYIEAFMVTSQASLVEASQLQHTSFLKGFTNETVMYETRKSIKVLVKILVYQAILMSRKQADYSTQAP